MSDNKYTDKTGNGEQTLPVTENEQAPAAKAPAEQGGISFKAPGPRFIRQQNTPFVSAKNAANDKPLNTTVEKYADRLNVKPPEPKKHTGYTGKINTYSANHSPAAGDKPKFIPLSEEMKAKEAAKLPTKNDTPERAAVSQDRIRPQEIVPEKAAETSGVIVEQLNVPDEASLVEPLQPVQPQRPRPPRPRPAQPVAAVGDDEEGFDDFGTENAPRKPQNPANRPPRPPRPPRPRPDGAQRRDKAPTKNIGEGRGDLLREIAKTSAEELGGDPGQLVLDGFGEEERREREAQLREEEELDEELDRTRQKRISGFHFWSKAESETGETDDKAFTVVAEKKSLPDKLYGFAEKFDKFDGEFLHVRCDEYRDFSHRKVIFKKLIEIRKAALIKAAILAVLGLIMFLINIAGSVSAAQNDMIRIMGESPIAYATVNTVFLALAAAVLADDFKNGFFSLLQAHPKADAALLFTYLLCLAQNIAAFFPGSNVEADYHLLTGAVILLSVPLMLAKSFYYDNIRHCFKTVSAKSEKAYLRKVSDKKLCAAVSSKKDPDANVVYVGKTRFIANFIGRSRSSANGGQTSSKLVLLSMALSVIIGAAAMVIHKDVRYGLSAMCLASALSCPLGCVAFSGFMLSSENKALSVKSAYIQSYMDAHDLSSVDELVISAEDAIRVEITGTVPAPGVSEKQANYVAAVLTDAAGGILKAPFARLAGEASATFPKVEDLTYENKLGFSAWISGNKVLLGSAQFLGDHNVELPGYAKSADEDEKALYLALEGHYTAKFVVRYSSLSDSAARLRMLADNGTNILVIAGDPNITDVYIERLLGLPSDSVRTVGRKAADKISEAKETVTDGETAGIVFTDSFDTLSRCAYSALKLDSVKKTAKIICEAGSVAGLLISLILALTHSVSGTACWLPLLMQILWIFLCFMLPAVLSPASAPALRKATVRPMTRGEVYTPENYQGTLRRSAQEPDDYDDEEDLSAPADPAFTPAPKANAVHEPSVREQIEMLDREAAAAQAPATRAADDLPYVMPELPKNDFGSFSLKGTAQQISRGSRNPFFDDLDENRPRRAARYEEAEEDEDDDFDEFDDGDSLLSRVGSVFKDLSGKTGGLAQKAGELGRGLKKTASGLTSGRRREEDFDDEDYDDVTPSGGFRTSSRSAERKREPERRSILSFSEDKLPSPPVYDLNKKEDDLDFLNVKFEPPTQETGENVYNDSYFSRYSDGKKKRDDDPFAGLKDGNEKTFRF